MTVEAPCRLRVAEVSEARSEWRRRIVRQLQEGAWVCDNHGQLSVATLTEALVRNSDVRAEPAEMMIVAPFRLGKAAEQKYRQAKDQRNTAGRTVPDKEGQQCG